VISFVAKGAVFGIVLRRKRTIIRFSTPKLGFLASEAFTKMLESSMEEEA